MIRALDNGDRLCSFMHNLISLLLMASRPDLDQPHAPCAPRYRSAPSRDPHV
jgi:hypothetical protein